VTVVPLAEKRPLEREVERIVKAAERTLVVRREVWDLCGDLDVDEHFIKVLVSLYRDERRWRKKA